MHINNNNIGNTKTLTTPPEVLGKPPQTSTKGKGIKILPPKQLLQRLPILPAQVQAGDTSKNLLIEIREIVY